MVKLNYSLKCKSFNEQKGKIEKKLQISYFNETQNTQKGKTKYFAKT